MLASIGCGDSSTDEPSATPSNNPSSNGVADTGVSTTPDTSEPDTGTTVAEYPASYTPGPTAMRRLTGPQFENSVRDILGDGIVIPELAEPDLPIGGLLSVGASVSTLGARGVESLESAAYAVAEQAMDTPERRTTLVSCTPADTVDSGCAEQFVAEFGRMAWRRALTNEERAQVVSIADQAAEQLNDFYDGLEFAVAALLQSPNFLFRIELGTLDPNTDTRTFTDLELASRLSFFLWNTTPDAELLNAAEAGELSTDEGLRAQAERLLASPTGRVAKQAGVQPERV
ncbi:MAG: DUF1595 domain-containing protein, partial [Myxococcota bacterium]